MIARAAAEVVASEDQGAPAPSHTSRSCRDRRLPRPLRSRARGGRVVGEVVASEEIRYACILRSSNMLPPRWIHAAVYMFHAQLLSLF